VHFEILKIDAKVNPLNAELNPICRLLACLGAHLILHNSRIRVNIYSYLIRTKNTLLRGREGRNEGR
jgi:hypothetical protein